MTDLYEFTVEWPSTSAQSVIVTGDFDKWSKSLPLTRSSTDNSFTATIKVPYGCPTRYKFIVDGQWTIKSDQPTEITPEGYVNNIHYVPLKAPSAAKPSANAKRASGNGAAGQPLGISDFKDTIVASAGTSSALSYVASGIGGVVRSVVGVDPFNANQIAIPSPITPNSSMGPPSSMPNGTSNALPATGDTNLESMGASGTGHAATPSGPTEPTGSTIAPIVPITIVPVYARENCTIDPTKVTSEEENIGKFVGVRIPPKRDVEEESKRDKSTADEETPGVPSSGLTVITSPPTPPGEPSTPATANVETSKEEKPAVEASVPEAAPVTVGEPVAQKPSTTVTEEAPKKAEESPAPTPAPAPASEHATPPGDKTTTNGHTQAPVPGTSKRPTTPTNVPAPAGSVTTSPSSTVRKSKIFPHLGNGSPSKSSKSNSGSTDDFGVRDGKSTTSSRKKRSSFLGSLKKIFHHDKHEEKKEKTTR